MVSSSSPGRTGPGRRPCCAFAQDWLSPPRASSTFGSVEGALATWPTSRAARSRAGSGTRPRGVRAGDARSGARRTLRVGEACARVTYLADVGTLARKDLLLELRARDTLPAMLLFVLSTLVIFHFVLPGDSSDLAAAGLLWVAIVFTSLLGLA